MKALLTSDAPWTSSGYSKLSLALAYRMRADGHDPVFFCPGGAAGAPIPYDGFRVLPAAWRDDRWGNTAYPQWLAMESPDVVITLLDAQGLGAWGNDPTPWWAWAPIDTWPLSVPEAGILGRAERVLVPSRWGTDVALQANLKAEYLPYGVEDAEVAFSAEGRQRFRERLGLADDIFLVGMVGVNYANPDRKGHTFGLEALAALAKRWPNVRGWLHTSYAMDGSMDLLGLRHELGLDNVLGISTAPLVGYSSQEDMRDMFSGFDCLLQSSTTEGFGLPVIEMQLNGAPVVVNGGTALRELAGPRSGIAEPAGHMWIADVSRISLPSVPNLTDQLDLQYRAWRLDGPRAHQQDHVDWASAWAWDKVYDRYWRPLLAETPQPLSFGEHKGRPKLQIGCGRVPLDGYVHHDREIHAPYVDIAHNLEEFPWPWGDDEFGSILCTDVLEHVRGEVHTYMDELHRILEPGGFLTISTCLAGSWQHSFDPTHVRGFALNSFDYWDPELPWGKAYGMEVGARTWRVVRRSLRAGQIEVIMQSRKDHPERSSNGWANHEKEAAHRVSRVSTR